MPEDNGIIVNPRSEEEIPAGITHRQRAAEINKLLDRIVLFLPKYPEVETSQVEFVRRRQAVTDAFIAKSITTTESTAELKTSYDTADSRDFLACEAAIRPVVDRMTGINSDIRFMLDARRAIVGARARQVYGVAQAIARHAPATAEIAEHVRNMRAELPVRKSRGKAGASSKANEVKPADTN